MMIRDACQEICEASETRLLLVYGSRKVGSDRDFLLVESTGQAVPYDLPQRKLDILRLTETDFYIRLGFLDPVVTEPLLTGEFVGGNNETYLQLLAWCQSVSVPPFVPQVLRSLGEASWQAAKDFADHRETPGNTMRAMVNSTFALSYALFAGWYEEHCTGAVTLKRLLTEPEAETTRQALAELKRLKHEPNTHDVDLSVWLARSKQTAAPQYLAK